MIEINKTYQFVVENIEFGNIPKEILYELFKDGRVASNFISHQIEIWFPSLKFVDKAGYDCVDSCNDRYEIKSFTKHGACFTQSKYQGCGRKLDVAEHTRHACGLKYIFVDITEFPTVNIICKNGFDLMNYANGQIPYGKKQDLFI